MKKTVKLLFGLLLLGVAIECDRDEHSEWSDWSEWDEREDEHSEWSDWDDKDDDDHEKKEWRECDEDWHCEMRDAMFSTDERECCDGECKEHCDQWWHVVLFLLLSLGCCFGCLGAIGGVVYCAALAAHKNANDNRPDPTVQAQSAPAYSFNAYGAPPAYGGDMAGPLPPKM